MRNLRATNTNTLVRSAMLRLLAVVSMVQFPAQVGAFDYVVAPNDDTYTITLTDMVTNVSDIPTIFTNANATVHVHGIQWHVGNSTAGAELVYTTFLDDQIVSTGAHSLQDTVPPSTVTAGYLSVDQMGQHNVTVTLQVRYTSDPSILTPTVSTSRLYQSYLAFFTLAPIAVLALMTCLTGNVEISISTTNLVSVIITKGSFFKGMEHLVYGCILGALTNTYNGVIMLFVFFLSGIMSLVEVTGGSKGLSRLVARHIKQTRLVQLLALICGVFYFWDDLLSILLVGHLFRPLLDVAHTSRPLIAFILDASAGPITGIIILSTWLTWEIPLLQQELSRIEATQDLPMLDMTPLEVLRESLHYAFYPILMLLLLPLLVWSQRQVAFILMYERVAQVYQSKHGGTKDTYGPCQPNLPVPSHTPCRFWNSFFPLLLISVFFIIFWVQTGISVTNPDYIAPPGEEGIVTTFAYGNISLAWLQAIAMAASFFVVFLLLQWQEGDGVLFLPCSLVKIVQHNKAQKAKLTEGSEPVDEDDGLIHSPPEPEIEILFQPLIPMMELIGTFFFGFSRVMPFVIQFMLAWALRQSWTEVGMDRWFASMFGTILDTWGPEMIPTAAFIAAFAMSMATGGASQGKAASILLPMAITPIYQSTLISSPRMVFQVIGAILSGCIAGDQAAPLSNTTLLSCLAADCHIIVHVISQLPYILVVFLLTILFGTGPVGFGLYPVGAGYFLGLCSLVFFVFFLCFPILDSSGQWDFATRLYIRFLARKNKVKNDIVNNEEDTNPEDGREEEKDEDEDEGNFWDILQRDTIRAANAISQGVSYNTEDCRPLMQPVDAGVTKGHGRDESLRRTSSSGGSSIGEHHPPICESLSCPVVEAQYSPDDDSENNNIDSRSVRIMATDATQA